MDHRNCQPLGVIVLQIFMMILNLIRTYFIIASLSENIPLGSCNTVSFTGYLERFSFSIFHPYGRQHQQIGRSRTNSFMSSRSNVEGRDSLSLHVESAKVSITRKSLVIPQHERLNNKVDITNIDRIYDPSAKKFRVKYHTAGTTSITYLLLLLCSKHRFGHTINYEIIISITVYELQN